jgi:serine phosphatase RsbU (regulator of sigma subunit)/CHASE3 domain sensor protein
VPLRTRLLALLGVLVLVVAAIAVSVNLAFSRVTTNRALVTERLEPAGQRSRSLLVSLVDQETGERGYVLTGDRAFLAPYRSGRTSFRRGMSELRSQFRTDPGMSAALRAVDSSAATWRRVGAIPEIRARQRGGEGAAAALVRTGRGKRAFDEVRSRVDRMQRILEDRTARAESEDRRALRLLRVVFLAGRLAVLLFLVVGALLTRRWLLAPVSDLRARMRRVASGNLDEEVLVSGPPEVAAIARDAESMRRRIVSELEATRGATEALSQHSPVVSALRGELAARASADGGSLEISGMVQSAEGVLAGDWWEAVPRPDGTTALVLADVSGHGPEAGLVAFAFKQRITALLGTALDLGDVFAVASRGSANDDERFLSCLLVVVDPARQELSWVNAGHPAGLVVSGEDRSTVTRLDPTGPLISSLTSGWTVAQAPFRRTDLLIACTDGVLEARDEQGEEFGSDRLLGVVRRLRVWSAAEAVAECGQAVRQFAADVRRDDVTCVALTLA